MDPKLSCISTLLMPMAFAGIRECLYHESLSFSFKRCFKDCSQR